MKTNAPYQREDWITPIMDHHPDHPITGQFAVRLNKGAPERALSIICNDGLWNVHLDGKQVANPAINWRQAFGWLGDRDLSGRKVAIEEYRRIIAITKIAASEGRNPELPIDFNTVKIP